MGLIKVTKEDLAKGKIFGPGWFTFLVTKYEEKKSKNKDNPSTNHIFTLTCQANGEPENDAMMGAGFPVFFNEQAIGNIGPFFEALGAKKDEAGEYAVEPLACVGKKIDGFCEPRKEEGKTYNQVNNWRPSVAA